MKTLLLITVISYHNHHIWTVLYILQSTNLRRWQRVASGSWRGTKQGWWNWQHVASSPDHHSSPVEAPTTGDTRSVAYVAVRRQPSTFLAARQAMQRRRGQTQATPRGSAAISLLSLAPLKRNDETRACLAVDMSWSKNKTDCRLLRQVSGKLGPWYRVADYLHSADSRRRHNVTHHCLQLDVPDTCSRGPKTHCMPNR